MGNFMKREKLTVGLKKSIVVWGMMLFMAIPYQADAYRFKVGDFDVSFDSTFSIGGSIRVEDRNADLIGKSNNEDLFGDANDPNTVTGDQDIFDYDDDEIEGNLITKLPRGAWNPNGDDGNLNFDTGFFSQVIKGVHEFEIKKGNFGVFTRANWFYDHYLMSESDDMRVDVMDNDDAKDNHGYDIDILDYFFYSRFEVSRFPVALRVGSQVINWGESALMRHGLNVSNPLDAAKFRAPGAEVKDALVPQGSIFFSVGLTNNISFESYYQYEWEATVVDSPGTYFSTSDVAGAGGEYLQLGFAQFADYHNVDKNSLLNTSKYFVVRRAENKNASDTGQHGLKVTWFAENLNETEFGFYYSNYHSHTPILNMFSFPNSTFVPEYRFVYPEDIQLYGMSFNTLLPFGIACGGEVAYRKDEPYQIDGVEMSFKLLETLQVPGIVLGFPTIPLINPYAGVSQISGSYNEGEEIKGYIRLDSFNYDINFTKFFFNILGADQITTLLEIACTKILDMPDRDVLRLETPGTDRSGNSSREYKDASGNIVNKWTNRADPLAKEGYQPASDFADDFSWGYALIVKATFNDVFLGVNISPLISLRHDVSGTAPSSAGTFIEDRKTISLKLGFDYRQNWSWDIGYIMYTGGDGSTGTSNMLEDRDYISFNLKYSI